MYDAWQATVDEGLGHDRLRRHLPAWGVACLLSLAAAALLSAPAHAPAQGMAPGGSMREHMREMMRGAVPPPGMVREALPEPDSAGAASA